jgi:sugar-specific transcriptional regulator TrmB
MNYLFHIVYSMGSLSRKQELFKQIEACLVATGFDQTDARIYVLALNKGTVDSSDVADEFPEIRQTTAVERLKHLAKKGFLELISRETSSKRPYAMEFKAIHPRTALEETLEKTKELPRLLELYDEHWDFLSENPKQDDETWLAKSEKIGTRIGASVIRGAKHEIRIYSHDCSWFQYNDIQTSLEKALSNGASVTVIAHNPESVIAKNLQGLGVSLYACKNRFGPPFCIVDRDWLFLPIQTGTLSKQFTSLRTNNRYLLDNFLSLFENALSCSIPWGEKNV